MKEVWNDYEITYDENAEEFIARKDNQTISKSKSLKALKDKLVKSEKEKYPRVSAFKRERWGGGGFVEITITSKAESSYHQNQVWCSDKKKKREKISADGIFLDTKENREKIDMIGEAYSEVQKLQEQINDLIGSLEKFNFENYKPIGS